MRLTGLLAVCLLAGVLSRAEPPNTALLAARAEQAYREAGARHAQTPTDATLAWQLARACFDWAEFATNDTQRATLAQEGIAVARPLVRQHPKLAPAHYYLAMNLGQLARTRKLGALPLVSEMEKHFEQTRTLDPDFDQAGADRCLGLLYRDAPGWPVSVGSKSKARAHLRRAVERCPDSPENRLNLLEALVAWGDLKAINAELEATARMWPKARTELTGEEWAAHWADWDRRWQAIRHKLNRTAARPTTSSE